MTYIMQTPEEKIANVIAKLVLVGRHDSNQDAILEVADEFLTVLIALAYLANKTPREACDLAFKAAPTDELWTKMCLELEAVMDRL